jgi:hypothetical protein
MHIVRSVNREGINRSENRRAFFQRFRNPVGLLTQKLRLFDEALFTRIIKTSWYLTTWLEFTTEPNGSRCCGHRVALFEGSRGRAGAHALRIPGLTPPGYMMSPSSRALVGEPGLAPRESRRIPGLTPPGYVMPPSSRALVAEPGLAWCESRPNRAAHATGLSSVEFGRTKNPGAHAAGLRDAALFEGSRRGARARVVRIPAESRGSRHGALIGGGRQDKGNPLHQDQRRTAVR